MKQESCGQLRQRIRRFIFVRLEAKGRRCWLAQAGKAYAPNRVLVRWKKGLVTPQALSRAGAGIQLQRSVGLGRAKLYTIINNATVDDTIAALKSLPGAPPSDTHLGCMWEGAHSHFYGRFHCICLATSWP